MSIDELELSTSSRPTRRGPSPPRRRPPRPRWWIAAAGLAAVLGGAAWMVLPMPASQESSSGPPPTWSIEVSSDPPGAEILVDGASRGTTPATVELDGPAGRGATIHLVRNGEIVAQRDLEVGPDLPQRWVPRLRRPPVEYRLVSRPDGAAVTLDGDRLGATTPLTVALDPDARHHLRIELAGFHEQSLTFTLDDLRESQREKHELFFPLQPVIPPATLVVVAPFAVRVATGGESWSVDGRRAISLAPGSHQVSLTGTTVVFEQRLTLDLSPGERRELRLPEAVTVRVMAQPGRCRLSVDGREVDWLPADVDLALGPHRLTFEWDQLGAQRTLDVEVTPETRRLVVSATGGGGADG